MDDEKSLRTSRRRRPRSEEHTSELQTLMRISYAVFCLKKKTRPTSWNKHSERNRRSTISAPNCPPPATQARSAQYTIRQEDIQAVTPTTISISSDSF